MRHVIFLDNKISQSDLESWRGEDERFWKEYIGMRPTYEIVQMDYSDYPTFVDSDGDIRPRPQYLKSLNDQAVAKFGEFGFDFLIVAIHEDNWKSDPPGPGGIWGTNYSYLYGKQCLEYCRWDKDNLANVFGTLYHERHHSLDAILKQELAVYVEPLFNLKPLEYDYAITHGNKDPWKYIRHKENTDSLKKIAPYLREAFSKRELRHNTKLNKMQKVIDLLTQVVYLLRAKIHQKNGVSKG